MKIITMLLLAILSILSCKSVSDPTTFSEAALNDTFISLDGSSEAFKAILDKHKGETLLIDVWASWCGDCLRGLPKVKKLQDEYKDVTLIFLSLDRDVDAWKKGIIKHDLSGEHYFMQSGWKGPFGTFLDLDWIPRYIIVDKQGNISLFKATKANDKRIKQNL